jgi:hypothetical protein
MAAADIPIPIPRVTSVECGTFKFPSSFAFIPSSNLSLFFIYSYPTKDGENI